MTHCITQGPKTHQLILGVPEKFLPLIWRKLKTTVFTRFVFIILESSYFSLQFGIKQSKIGWKCAEQWIPNAKISGRVDDTLIRSSHIALTVHWSVKISWNCKRHHCLLSYQVNQAFGVGKVMYEMKYKQRYRYHLFFVLIITLLLSRIFSSQLGLWFANTTTKLSQNIIHHRNTVNYLMDNGIKEWVEIPVSGYGPVTISFY